MKKKLLFLLDHVEEIVLVPGFALMLLIGFGNVLSRFVLHVVSCNRCERKHGNGQCPRPQSFHRH